MVAEKKVVNSFLPPWIRSPEKFMGAHKGIIKLSLSEWEQAGKGHSLNKFIAEYVSDLPENLPPAVLLDVTKWAIEGYEAWQAAKNEAAAA